MNPFDKGMQARKGCAPREIMEYENANKNLGTTVVFSQPRSGSTLLLRLMAIAGRNKVVGDCDPRFYKGLVDLHKYAFDGTYGNVYDLENQGIFIAEYKDKSQEQDMRLMNYYIKNLLTRGGGTIAFVKITTLGINDGGLLGRFVDMLRGIYEDDPMHPLTVGFLTRNHDEIINSINNSDNNTDKELVHLEPEWVKDTLKLQWDAFMSVYELGDYCFNYKDILEDPVKVMKKLGTKHHPTENKINEVMSKVIR